MPRCRVDAAIPARKQLYSRLSKTFVARKFSRLTLFHGCFVQSTIRFPSLGRRCPPLSLSLSPPHSLLPLRRIIPYSPCLLGAGHTDASLHFALALLLQVQSPHCYNGWPLLALLPVLLLLSLLLPVAADRRMEKRRASCFVECRIRGKLHSLWPAFLSLFLFFTMSLQAAYLVLSQLHSGFHPFFKLEISNGRSVSDSNERCLPNAINLSRTYFIQPHSFLAFIINLLASSTLA